MRLAPWLAAAALLAPPPAAQADEPSPRHTPVVRAVQRVVPATVNITTTKEVHRRVNPFFRGDPFFEEFFGMFVDPRPSTRHSLGTGVIIGAERFVLTNQHVLAGASEIRVTLSDGREFAGELLGSDPETDLAVLRVETDENLPGAPLGRSDDLLIGETVIAIGNPFGLGHTVTTGVLSASNRSIRARAGEYHGFLQTDASINPGNSGGPLVNLDGDVIGINTAIIRDAQGIGFAIPIDRARRIAEELIEHGELIPVWLGLRLQDLTPGLRDALEVRARSGALVSHLFGNSPGARAGLRRGDVVLELEGTRIQSSRNYFEVLRGLTSGSAAALRIERDGEVREFQVHPEVFPEDRADELGEILIGVLVSEVGGRGPEKPGAAGMLVREVVSQSPADRAGLRPGDRILKLDQEQLAGRADFRRAVSRLRGRRQVLLLVQRGQRGYHVTLGIS